jgi:hypothetical protein
MMTTEKAEFHGYIDCIISGMHWRAVKQFQYQLWTLEPKT